MMIKRKNKAKLTPLVALVALVALVGEKNNDLSHNDYFWRIAA